MLALAIPGPVQAHAGASPRLLSAWTWDLPLSLALVGAILLYAAGLANCGRRARPGQGIRRSAAVAFHAGMLALAIAFVWPLDALQEWSLAAHMAQHMLLIAVAAPLILLGRPDLVWLRALPLQWARQAARLVRALARQKVIVATGGITAATLLQAGVMWSWHVPAAMQLALTNGLAHYAMHGSFLAAGLLFWSALLRSLRAPGAGFGAGAIALVATMMHMGLLSALLTFSQRPRYPWYFDRAAAFGLTPLEDQQLAGLIMWVPGGLPYLVGVLALCAAWLRRSERYDARSLRGRRSPPAEQPGLCSNLVQGALPMQDER